MDLRIRQTENKPHPVVEYVKCEFRGVFFSLKGSLSVLSVSCYTELRQRLQIDGTDLVSHGFESMIAL